MGSEIGDSTRAQRAPTSASEPAQASVCNAGAALAPSRDVPERKHDGASAAPTFHETDLRIFRWLVLALLLVLLLALAYRQLVQSAKFTALERRQTLRRVTLPAPRGVIRDREHRVLVDNRSASSAGYPSYERVYPYGNVAAHVLGRVRRERILTPIGSEYPILNYIDLLGESGIEKQWDARLRGRTGSAVMHVDVFGKLLAPSLEHTSATAGEDIELSLDLDVQLATERAMAGKRGAAVALAVRTGEVLAMVSKPDFDLGAISPVLTRSTKQRLDAESAWLNRATQALYPPGSLFKVFTVLAGLRSGTLHPNDSVYCEGSLLVGDRRYPCHRADGHGDVTLRTALAHSCNVYAYEAGLAAGPEALAAEARRFHFSEPTGIDLPFETHRMLVADPAWKQQSTGERWTSGDTANFAIGQGFLRISPLQAACAMASLARRETLTVPTLLKQPTRRASGDRSPESLDLSAEDYAALVQSLEAVVQTGIGREAQVPGVRVAGKSGTAQVQRANGNANIAWFVAFAPVEQPEIAIAVALEGGEAGTEFAGAKHAAPVVREMAGAYFDKTTYPKSAKGAAK